MSPDELLGCRVTLRIARLTPPGAFLALDGPDDESADEDAPTILLPSREVPVGARPGDPVLVFIHLDSEERPIATTREPKLTLGQVTFLEVTDVTSNGAFVDLGLGKELLIPFAEQSRELHIGDRHPIGLYVDRTRRLAGTMHVSDMLDTRPRRVVIDEWIEGEAWRNDPDIGLFVILEKSYVGLVPASEPHDLHRGDVAKFRVAHIQPDGKLVLSLRAHAYQEAEADAAKILSVLRKPGVPRVGDRSSPEQIRSMFGLSKKAFKRAVGRLLKERAVILDADGYVSLPT